MWALLSTRLRTWLFLAVAIPVARRLVHLAADEATKRSPDATPAKLLRRADEALTGSTGHKRK